MPLEITPIEKRLIELLATSSPIRGTAQVGYALWPNHNMQPQGAALAAGRVVRGLRDKGLVASYPDRNLSRYEITDKGRKALEQIEAD